MTGVEIEAEMFAKRKGEEKQEEFWIERARVSKPPSQGFYSKLNEHLAAMNFARQVWALCEPAYREESRGGRPGIDPARSRRTDFSRIGIWGSIPV